MWPNPQILADLVTFTEEILNEKLFYAVGEIWTGNLSQSRCAFPLYCFPFEPHSLPFLQWHMLGEIIEYHLN